MEYESAYKVLICSDVSINQNILKEFLKTVKGMLTDSKTLCQIVNSDASKLAAISYLASILNIENEDIIAFGDDINDIDMIKNAGLGVAMGNGEDIIKNIADYITDTNENDGVAKFLRENNCF